MFYKFKCEKCNTTVERQIPIDDYDKEKNNQKCNNCGNTLVRVIEFEGAFGNTGGYDSVAGRAGWQY